MCPTWKYLGEHWVTKQPGCVWGVLTKLPALYKGHLRGWGEGHISKVLSLQTWVPIPTAHLNSWVQHASIIPALGWQSQEDPQALLAASLAESAGSRFRERLSQNTRWKMSETSTSHSPLTFTHVHTSTCEPAHTHTYTHTTHSFTCSHTRVS